MKSIFRIFAAVLSLGLVVSCSSAPKKNATGFMLRSFQEEVLPNGMRLLVIPDSSLPRVSMQMMIAAGSLYDTKEKAGLSALMFGLMDQGTVKMSAPQIADAFAQIGSEFGAQAGSDSSFITASAIAPSKDEMLRLYFEVLTHAEFSQKELDRRKAQHLAAIQKAKDQPQSFTDKIFDEALFENHPYGVASVGTPESLKKITRADVITHFKSWVRPEMATLAVVGQVDDAFIAELKKTFGAWKVNGPKGIEPVRAAAKEGALKRLVTKKDLQQTQIRIGHMGIQRKDADFLKMRMASLVLGGAFASRLNQAVRDDLGLTYSISSSSDARLDRGSFEISTFTRNEKAAETIRETLKVVDQFVDKGVTERELDAAKALLIGQFPAALETPDRLAYNLMVLRRYGIGDDYLRNFHSNVDAVSLKDVNEAIKRHIHPDAFRIVVYADQVQVLEPLKTLGNWEVVEAK